MPGIRRNAEEFLGRWYDKPRRKPLVIRGARQVGKSTLVREFAARRSLPLREVNLEQRRTLESVFATLDASRIVPELEGLVDASLRDGDLLFLDELQATPSALPALRYLYEARPGLAVVAAGSLLEMLLGHHAFAMPVGRVEYFHLGPLTFTEYLEAVGERGSLDLVREWREGRPFADTAHERLCRRQREFMLVGGMPEAVAAWAAERSFAPVQDVHRSILATYRDDFSKYCRSPEGLCRLQRVMDYIPTALGQKFKYSNIDRDTRARELRSAVEQLAAARVISLVPHSECSGVPLGAEVDSHTYKALFLDIGLCTHALGIRWNTLGSLDDRALVNEGGLAEQVVGQSLLYRARGVELPTLFYWLREGRANSAEVDYVIDHEARVIPIEVKAGKSGTLKSLISFLGRGSQTRSRVPLAVRFDLNPPSSMEVEHRLPGGAPLRYRLLSLPLYLADQVSRILD